MKAHLSSQQISRAVLGDFETDAREHLHECPGCQAEVARFASDLSLFGSAVRQWSEVEVLRTPVRRGAVFPRWMSMGAALAAVLLLCVFAGLYRFHRSAPQQAEITDAALMQRVDSELSRSVPGPMEPLVP